MCEILEVERTLASFIGDNHEIVLCREGHSQIWYRGRACPPEGWPNLTDCIYRTAPKVSGYGRAHYPNQSIFYASWNIATVLAELRPKPETFVQVIAVRPKEGVTIRCHVVGEVEHVFLAGRSLVNDPLVRDEVIKKLRAMPPEELPKLVYKDAFFAELFSRPVDKTREHEHEYKITAAHAQLFFNEGYGLIYPSVQNRGGNNLAVPAALFDEYFEVLWTEVCAVKAEYGSGIYNVIPPMRGSCEFERDGRIVWESTRTMNRTFDYQRGFQVEGGFEGWRVPR